GHQVPERHVLFQGVRDVGEGAELEPVQVVDRVLEGLARQRAGVDARAAEYLLLLDDGHALSQLGRLDGGLLAGGTAADHQQVEFMHSARSGCTDQRSINTPRPLTRWTMTWRKQGAAGRRPCAPLR